ncbi:MAG: helix-turn-helix transcriptional regulator [Pseudomonadota bacterium]
MTESEEFELKQGIDLVLENMTREKAHLVLDKLTERETEFLVGLAHTKTYKQIALEMSVGESRVKQYATAVKKKLSVGERADAVAAFVIARQLCNRPVYTERHLLKANHVINKLVSDQSIEDAFAKIASPVFQEYLRDLRSSGPEAWTAKYGPWWRLIAGAMFALFLIVTLERALSLGSALDVLSR